MTRLLCLGPEDSGNRLVHRILLTAGDVQDPEGDWVHYVWPVKLPSGGTMWITGRSLPHGSEWPDIGQIIDEFGPNKVLVVWRDRQYQVRAAHKTGHVGSVVEAEQERDRAEDLLAKVHGDVYHIIYELLVREPAVQVANLSRWLGVKLRVPETIYNADRQQ